VKLVSEAFDFFFESELSLFELCERQIVGEWTVELVVDLFVEFVVLIRKFLDMRL
jgi:AAA+ ATPase superfamily predicted ATPase